MKLVEFYRYDEPGYQKLFNYNSWRLAILNYIDELDSKNIEYVEAHFLTDEAFILLEGRAIIYVLDEGKIKHFMLNKNEVCNIKVGVYHTHVLSKDCKLLIIEEESTNYENSKRIYLNEEQKSKIVKVWEEYDKI